MTATDFQPGQGAAQASGSAPPVEPGSGKRSAPREPTTAEGRAAWRALRHSPLTRKIITFNLVALNVLVAGILYLNASRDGDALLRARALVAEAELVADVFEALVPRRDAGTDSGLKALDLAGTLAGLDLRSGVEVLVYNAAGQRLGRASRLPSRDAPAAGVLPRPGRARLDPTGLKSESDPVIEATLAVAASRSLVEGTRLHTEKGVDGTTIFTVATPILHDGGALGAVVLLSPAGEVDALVRAERLRVVSFLVVASAVSVGLSFMLARAVSIPISRLADAVEFGKAQDRGGTAPSRIRIPDLTSRPDEIGRLSGALAGLVGALAHRIEANEQFAADVAHEIKNPLASLGSAVGALRLAGQPAQKEALMRIIEHDVRRLDRLVSDISNASRLDSELVREAQTEFDLLRMLADLGQFLGEDAKRRGIDFIMDLPEQPVLMRGLEDRLAQVVVNLVGNAVSFCEDGDAIRVWARRRDWRVLVVVEDTGPGIPDDALEKIFERFYSHRPDQEFGNNSGLGLAISRQIVQAHDGVIWAENIRPTAADITSEPLGARFVVGLPVAARSLPCA